MIRQPNYEVGPEFVERFRPRTRQRAVLRRRGAPGHAMFDLPGFIASRLERAGIAGIEDLALCTYADPARFFSYRRATHRASPTTDATSTRSR